MADEVLLLYLRDEEYGQRLLRFLLGKKNPGFHPELVTARERIRQRRGMPSEKIVILTDDVEVYEDEEKEVILLANEQNREKKKIFQYQSGEEIYQELIRQLGLEQVQRHPVEKEEEKKKKGVVFLFSPGESGLTATAVMLSQYLGQQGKCLYISLSAFPLFYGSELLREPTFTNPGLGELLFCSGEDKLSGYVERYVQSFGKAELLAPMCHFKDMLDSSPEDWKTLFTCLRDGCGYDTIVVEVGQAFETLFELLCMGDEVWFLKRPNLQGQIREAVFRQYCRVEKKEELLAHTRFLAIPPEWEEWEEHMCRVPPDQWHEETRIMGEMADLWKCEEKEEDVCVWEDAG